MPEKSSDRRVGVAQFRRNRCKGMAQRMTARIRNFCFFEHTPNFPFCALVRGSQSRAGEDEFTILMLREVLQDLLNSRSQRAHAFAVH